MTSQSLGLNTGCRAATLGRGPVVNPAHAWDLRLALGRSLVIEQLVVLKREGQIATTGMADDVDPGAVLQDRQGSGNGQQLDALDGDLEPQDAGVVPAILRVHTIRSTW